LTARAIEHARDAGARRVHLFSSSRLGGALRLYKSMGFRRRPLPGDAGYATADVYMELELSVDAV